MARTCAGKIRRKLLGGLLSAALFGFATKAKAQASPHAISNSDAALHRQVLTQRIDQLLRVQVVAEVIGVFDVALGTTAIALVVPQNFRTERAASLSYLAGFGAIDAVAAASLFLTRDARSRLFQVIIPTTAAVAALGPAVAHDPYPLPRLTMASMSAGFFASAILEGINDFSTPTPFSRLRAHRKRLEEAQDLSDDERTGMHRAVIGARGPLPRWIVGVPTLIAGAVAISPAFSDRYLKDEKTWAGLLGGITLASSLPYLFPGVVDAYENDVETFYISVALVPGGISARGAFSAF